MPSYIRTIEIEECLLLEWDMAEMYYAASCLLVAMSCDATCGCRCDMGAREG